MGKNLPVPTFDTTAWAAAPRLRDATVAIVTSAALHRAHDDRFSAGDWALHDSYQDLGLV